MRALIGIVLLLLLGTAWATDFEWVNPIEYENGTPLPAAELLLVTLICEGQTFVYTMGETMSMEDFSPGTYSCVMTATASEAAGGLTSAPSNVVSFTIAQPPSPPNPPILSVIN